MYTISGKVIKGKQRGRDLGFPTANVAIEHEIPQGIYVSRIRVKESGVKNQELGFFPSVTFIGNATTFGETEIKSETYILDFNLDLYGTMVEIELLKKIRGNEKFESVEKLIENMKEDVEKTREYFESDK